MDDNEIVGALHTNIEWLTQARDAAERLAKIWDSECQEKSKEISTLRAKVERLTKENEWLHPDSAEFERLRSEVERLNQHVNDLQSGMYINCVYCGHRYGPDPGTPVAMADVLKRHVEQCPKHPMSALKSKVERLTREREAADQVAKTWDSECKEKAREIGALSADLDKLTKAARALNNELVDVDDGEEFCRHCHVGLDDCECKAHALRRTLEDMGR